MRPDYYATISTLVPVPVVVFSDHAVDGCVLRAISQAHACTHEGLIGLHHSRRSVVHGTDILIGEQKRVLPELGNSGSNVDEFREILLLSEGPTSIYGIPRQVKRDIP